MSLDDLLVRQGGVVTLRQAVAAGIGPRTVQRRVRGGAWQQLHPQVYLVAGHRLTEETRVRAAGLWAAERGTVTGAAAAYWHGMLPRVPGPVEVTLPRALHRLDDHDVRFVRRDLHPVDRVRHRGLWVAARPLAALQTALVVENGSTFLDRALQRHVRFPEVHRAYSRMVGARGAAAASRLLTAAADRADSAAERLLVALLREAGITGWQVGFPFGPYMIDLAFPAEKVAVEVDGWAWHVDVDRFRADRRKGNALTADRWDLLRYTWHDLNDRSAACVREIDHARDRNAA